MSTPKDLRYTKDHEWARSEGELVVIGITDHAQEQLGDIVFVELPAPGSSVGAGETFGSVESVKAVSDLFAPLSGEVVEVNDALTGKPEAVNADPYGEAWMIKLRPTDAGALEQLLTPEQYEQLLSQG